jgi:hypothetical protein
MIVVGLSSSGIGQIGRIATFTIASSSTPPIFKETIIIPEISMSGPQAATSIIFTKEIVVHSTYELAAIINTSQVLITFRLDGSNSPSTIQNLFKFSNIQSSTSSDITIWGKLLLVESTATSTAIAVHFTENSIATNSRHSIGIIQTHPTPNSAFINELKINGNYLDNDNFSVKNSGVRIGLESTKLVILYNENLYV